jgi:hypothetical protein
MKEIIGWLNRRWISENLEGIKNGKSFSKLPDVIWF